MNSPRVSRRSPRLVALLARAREALKKDAMARGLLRAFGAAPLLLVASQLLVSRWPALGFGPWLLALAAIVALFAWPLLTVRRWLQDEKALAARIQSRRPAFRNDIQATLEFAESAPVDEDRAALRAQLEARVTKMLGDETRWDDILPARHPRLEGAAVGLALVAALILALSPAFRASVEPRVAAGGGEAPVLEERYLVSPLTVRVQPPAYTRTPPQVLEFVSGGVTVLEGTTLTIEGETFERPDAGWLQVDGDDERTPLTVDANGHFSARFHAMENARYRFGFRIRGRDVLDARPFHVALRPDEAPVLTLYEPEADHPVTPGEVVDLRYDVRDDYGVRDVHLVWYFQGREQDAERLPLLGSEAGTFAEDVAPFDTAPLYLQPGDEVVVYLEGRDNVDFRSPNVGRSEARRFFVEEPHRPEVEALALKEQLFEALLEQLAALLSIPMHSLHSDGDGGFEVRPREELAGAAHAANVRAVHEAQETWPPTHDALQALAELFDTWEELDAREQRLFETMQAGLTQRDRTVARHLEGLGMALEQGSLTAAQTRRLYVEYAGYIQDVERAALVVEARISEHQAADVARAIQELSEVRERLRELLEEYRETEDPELRARIERELDRLSARMRDLIETIASQVQNLPEEHFNAEALDPHETAEQVASMGDAMERMRDLLRAGDIDAAMEAFDDLSRTLDALEHELGDPFAGQGEDTLSAFDQAMGELMDEMNAIDAMQQALEDETSAMERELREERLADERETLTERLAEALEATREARERAASHDDPDATITEAQRDAQARLERLERSLENQDLAVAEDAALDAMEALRQLESSAARARRFRQDDHDQTLRSVETVSQKDAARMGEVAQELSELQQRLEPQPGPERGEQFESLRERQQQAAERAERLQQQMDEMGEQFPMMRPEGDATGAGSQAGEPGEGMQQLQDGMRDASSSLEQQRVPEARDGQRQALDALQTMREQLQQQMAQRRQQAQREAQRSGRGSMKQDEVDVSGDADRDLLRRQQIMEAMREGSLDAWDDPIRQYYESLVQ